MCQTNWLLLRLRTPATQIAAVWYGATNCQCNAAEQRVTGFCDGLQSCTFTVAAALEREQACSQ